MINGARAKKAVWSVFVLEKYNHLYFGDHFFLINLGTSVPNIFWESEILVCKSRKQ